jgi:hypothetical protein
VDYTLAKGRVAVAPLHGDRGEIAARLTFERSGKLIDIVEKSTLRAGVRPICQATKLLDPDPIVRRMAEQDILVMGLEAKPYLDYIRPQLSPELQAAVDKLWQRILEESRE